MSLYLPEQKLGSHSAQGSSSNKFILKGRQTGGMHRGHTWVFRAESHDTMMAWYEDIKALTEKTPQERSEYVRGHSRSFSRSSQRSFSSDGVVDEDDDEPFAAAASVSQQTTRQETDPARRPEPGGRFPSDLQVNAQRGLQVPASPSSVSTASYERPDPNAAGTIKEAVALPGSAVTEPQSATSGRNPGGYGSTGRTPIHEAPSHAAVIDHQAREDGVNPYTNEPFYDPNPAEANHKGDGAVGDGVLGGTQRLNSTAEGTGLMVVGEEELGRSQSNLSGGGRATEMESTPANTAPNPSSYRQSALTDAPTGHDARSMAGTRGPPTVDSINVPSYVAYTSTAARQGQEHIAENHSDGTTVHVARPTAGTRRNDSVPTISNLHVPGEYPRLASAL